jgi:hypothetical protein
MHTYIRTYIHTCIAAGYHALECLAQTAVINIGPAQTTSIEETMGRPRVVVTTSPFSLKTYPGPPISPYYVQTSDAGNLPVSPS